ncbi:MAG: VWA domain-containing protein [Bryobacteraceae bacterium]|jgi:Flp pilus assembly protein TadG
MKTKRDGARRRRGFALMYSAIALIVLTVFCGLAVDATVLFLCRAKLSAAVDASVLAGARSVNLADSVATAQSQAFTAAESFFSANFPSGYMGSQPFTMPAIGSSSPNGNSNYTVTFNWNATTGIITVTASASVQAPVYFMRILGFGNMTVGAYGSSQRRGLVMMLVLDISASMGNGAGSSCEAMVAAAQSFVNSFSPTDYIGLVTFSYTAFLKDAPTTNHAQVYADIGAITCGDNTNTISALEMAYKQIVATAQPLALNTIVLFTDGSPNGVTANFPARTIADTRYGPAMNAPDTDTGNNGPAPPAGDGTNCNSDVGGQDVNGSWNHKPCANMPAICTVATDTLFGTITQTSNQNSTGGDTNGIYQPANYGSFTATDADNAISLPNSCNYVAPKGSGYNSVTVATELANVSNVMRQYVAYIPNVDFYGNNLQHGVPVTTAVAGSEILGGWDTRENWLFQVVNTCNPAGSGNCKNTGAVWLPTYAATGSGSSAGQDPYPNFFPTGTAYAGFLRPDQPNSIVAASMNGAMSEALRIRSDTTYNPVINCIYLTGNGSDSVDHEFLPIIANVSQITALPYDLSYAAPPNDPVLYNNPAYQANQQSGKYLVTSDKTTLGALFAQLASELLHLNQ